MVRSSLSAGMMIEMRIGPRSPGCGGFITIVLGEASQGARVMSEEVWFSEGLRFSCTRCGNCCTGAPGFVWVSPEELATLADYLEQPVEQVFALHTRVVN